VGGGKFFLEEDGRQDDFCPFYAEIIGAVEHRIDLETLSYMEGLRAGEWSISAEGKDFGFSDVFQCTAFYGTSEEVP
ncbi:MAG TPA: hypothetical protein VIL63_02475, partial [Terriglobales bacterium]